METRRKEKRTKERRSVYVMSIRSTGTGSSCANARIVPCAEKVVVSNRVDVFCDRSYGTMSSREGFNARLKMHAEIDPNAKREVVLVKHLRMLV
jgi:hypothetical protein